MEDRGTLNGPPPPEGVRAIRPAAGAASSQLSLLEPTAGAVARWSPGVSLGPAGERLCTWCGGPMRARSRRDSLTCSKPCRQARHRFGAGLRRLEWTDRPLKLAYADPPYPGFASIYKGHRDYGGEVDHAELIERLSREYPDGWALSTSAAALPQISALCVGLALEVRVGAWLRGSRRVKAKGPLSSWEPVVFAGGRRDARKGRGQDALVKVARARRRDPDRVIGAKPADFVWWLFYDLLDVRPGDQLDDLYPGSGGVGRAFAMLEQAALPRVAVARRSAVAA